VHLAHGGRGALVRLSFRRPAVLRHELAEHDDHGVRQRGLQHHGGGSEHGMTPRRVEAGKMPDGKPRRLVGQALEGHRRQSRSA
jgi:hypothetical protein